MECPLLACRPTTVALLRIVQKPCILSHFCFSTLKLLAIELLTSTPCPVVHRTGINISTVPYCVRLANGIFLACSSIKNCPTWKIISHHDGISIVTRSESFLALPMMGAMCCSSTTTSCGDDLGVLRRCCVCFFIRGVLRCHP